MSTITPGARTRRRPDALRFGLADLLGLVAMASVLVVVWMWMRNGGIQTGVSSVEGALSSLGLITGLVSSVLMILMVLALARIPLVERAWGHDQLTHRHRTLGYWSFWLMVAHVGLFAVERAVGAGWSGLYDVFIRNPWYLFATLGTGILIGVVVTSIRWARRRLRYESWHLLHLYSYLGMGLALPHQIFDGVHFHELWTRVYWWALYVLALGSVLLFRVGVPVWRSLYHRVRVTGVRRESDDVFSVMVQGHRLDRLRTRSGQFFIWRFRDGPGWSRGNPYTISAAPAADRLRVTIQAVGEGSARVERLRPGTKVAIEGPYGTMTAQRRRHPRMLVMAAGVGITPMRALIEDTPFAPGDAKLIYRYRRDPLFGGELEELAQRRGFALHLLPGSRARADSWVASGDDVEELLRLVPDVADRDVYLCGPVAWIAAVRRALKTAGVSRYQIHTEDFAW